LQETEADDNNEEDLTVTHRKHLRFFGVRWRYWRMSIAVLISICFAVAGIVLHDKQKSLVSLCDHLDASWFECCSVAATGFLQKV